MKLQVFLVSLWTVFVVATSFDGGDFDRGDIIGSKSQISPAAFTYRLPNNSIPLRYDLWLRTDVDKAIFDFSGRVRIHVRIIEDTEQITLNYRQISVEEVSLLDNNKSPTAFNLEFEFVPVFEFLVISLPRVFRRYEEIVLEISYNGELRSDGAGFKRDSYESGDETIWIASTRFLATDARHAFPCYDEPSFKAVFNLAIQHDKSYYAVSNTPLASIEDIPGTDYVTSRFQNTALMSTYLLGFVISDFSVISNNDSKLEQQIYAPAQSLNDGFADYAMTILDKIVKEFEKHFGMAIDLPQLDHVALRHQIRVSEEALGLVMYDENHFLLKNVDNDVTRENIAENIAQNVAHQWFGGLVTPAWWSFTWLNEAFSTLYKHIIVKSMNGESYDERLDRSLSAAYDYDTSKSLSSVPLNEYVESPLEIASKFGAISHQKGAKVLQMFREVLTPPTFTKGVVNYLQAFANSTATPGDLHRELQKAFDEDFPGNGINLERVMRTWEDQPGFPYIEVTKYGDKFKLTQWRHEYGYEIYSIPISYATKSEPTFNQRTAKVVMETKTFEIQSANHYDWIFLNIDHTGFYKVVYEKPIWRSQIDQLMTDHEVISVFHRRQMFRDLNEVLTAFPPKDFDYLYILDMLSYLGQENEAKVWEIAPAIFRGKIFATESYELYQEFRRMLVKPHLDRLGFEPIAGESGNDAELRKHVTAYACEANEERCLRFELSRVEKFLESGEGEINLCQGLKIAGSSIHSAFVNQLFSDEPLVNRETLIYHLSCSLNQRILLDYLKVVLDPTNNLTSSERVEIIEYTSGSSVNGLIVSLFFLETHKFELIELEDGLLRQMMMNMRKNVISEDAMVTFNQILNQLEEANIFSDGDFCVLEREFSDVIRWKATYMFKIESWLRDFISKNN